MKDRLLNYYSNELRARKIIYVHTKRTFLAYMILLIWALLLLISLIISLVLLQFTLVKMFVLMSLLTAFSIGYCIYLLNRGARRTLNKYFSVKTPSWNWYHAFREIQIHK